MGRKNRQMVLIKTDSHDVYGDPDEQWIGRAPASALLLFQELLDMPRKTDLEKQLEDLLWHQCKAWGWSKWDFRSTWYLGQVAAPVDYDPSVETDAVPVRPEEDGPSIPEYADADRILEEIRKRQKARRNETPPVP